MKIFKPSEVQPNAFYTVGVYGPPKSGKTRLVTCLDWGSVWGEEAVYCAWDSGAAALSSTPKEHRAHINVVVPEDTIDPKTGRRRYDPLTEAVAMATKDWQSVFPKARTIIWDTMTETSRQLLTAYADTGTFSDKHITFGTPGQATYHSAPMEGDYGAAQRSTLFILDLLFKQPMNVIVLFHDNVVTPDTKKGETFIAYGGPAIAGKAGTQAVAGKFDNLFRVEAEPRFDGNTIKPKHFLYSTPKGAWLAGFRNPITTGNPIARVELSTNPSEFWKTFISVYNNA